MTFVWAVDAVISHRAALRQSMYHRARELLAG
jgi:hypothetical protein